MLTTKEQSKQYLGTLPWQEGEHISLQQGPYRHEIVAVCSELGRQKATFADGQIRSYFCYIRMVDSNGKWHGEGGVTVPVLPDGRVVMIVDQRPVQSAFTAEARTLVLRKGGKLDLDPYASVEFPGGASEMGADLKMDYLHELGEETGVSGTGRLFRRIPAYYQFVSDVAARDRMAVVYLDGDTHASYTHTDGGLRVLALWPDEILHNIRKGVIASAHAALLPFYFYLEIEDARRSGTVEQLVAEHYLETGSITIANTVA